MANVTETDVEQMKQDYLDKYCTTYKVSREVAVNHELVKEVFANYDKLAGTACKCNCSCGTKNCS